MNREKEIECKSCGIFHDADDEWCSLKREEDGAASCYVLKILHITWVTILSTIAVILGYVICLLGLLAGQPDTSRDIARTLGIWWRE